MNHDLHKKLNKLQWLKKLCRGVTGFGFITSAAGNALHAVPTPIGVAISLLAPTFLFAAFELVTRIPMDPDRGWWFKLLRVGGTGSIASITATLSYFHQRDAIFQNTNGDQLAAYLLPVAIDGLMIVGSVSLIELGFQLLKVEAYIAAGNKPPKAQEPEQPKSKDKEPTGRERIAAIVAKAPELSIKDIAAAARTSYNYAYSVVKDLRATTAHEGALELQEA